MKTGLTYWILICLLAFPLVSSAGELIHTKAIKGDYIKPNAKIKLAEDRFTDPDAGYVKKIENHLILKYSGSARKYYSDTWEVEVIAEVKLYDHNSSTAFSTEDVTLTISYDQSGTTTYIDHAVWKATGGYQMTVKVISVTCTDGITSYTQLTNDIILESEIVIDRYEQFDLYTPILNPTATINTSDYSALITWDFVPGVEEYELEWVHINDASGANPLDFLDYKNSTRIATSNNWYDLNLPFEDGYIYCRVRPVGLYTEAVNTINFKLRAKDLGVWSELSSPLDLNDVYGDENERNWRYDVTYAEEGKRKEVLGVFDGSGRQRQTITINNTDLDAIVIDQVYDVEGRPTIQTLPAPTGQNSLHFYEDYSLNPAGISAFSKNDFDLMDTSGTGTVYTSAGMDNTSGASKYYSSNNTLSSLGFNAFLPDAEEIPYTRVVYGRDGRVAMQSGPGLTHAIGNGHETVMTYAGPLQQKLDRLFGNEVGYSDFYRVVMTEDANGQRSLSYQKLDGTVVATSLIGFPDAENGKLLLDTLDNNIGDTLTISFKSDNQINPATNYLEINKSFLVEDTSAPYVFNYSLEEGEFHELCTDSIFSCAYILTIELYDDQDRRIYDVPLDSSVYNASTDTSSPSVLFTEYHIDAESTPFTLDFEVNFPSVGKYRIVKTLSPDTSWALQQFDEYLAMVTDTNHASYSTCKIDWTLAPPDLSGCITDCDEYCIYYALEAGLTFDSDPGSDYQLFLDSCGLSNNCGDTAYTLEEIASCDILYAAIARDMSPGGQYFESNDLTGLIPDADNWFDEHVLRPSPNDAFEDMDFYTSQGVLINSYQMLRDNWRDTFLTQPFETAISITYEGITLDYNSLIEFHPEYCAYLFCLETEESRLFDLNLQHEVTTYAQAVDSGYIVCNGLPVGRSMIDQDPFFADVTDGVVHFGFTYDSLMRKALWDYDPTGSSTLWEMVIDRVEFELSDVSNTCSITYTCGGSPAVSFSNCVAPDTTVTATYIEDLVWQRFVNQYIYIKGVLLRIYRTNNRCPHLYDDPEAPDYYTDLNLIGSGSDFADSINYNNIRATNYVIRDPYINQPVGDDSLYFDLETGEVVFTDPDTITAIVEEWSTNNTDTCGHPASTIIPVGFYSAESGQYEYVPWIQEPMDLMSKQDIINSGCTHNYDFAFVLDGSLASYYGVTNLNLSDPHYGFAHPRSHFNSIYGGSGVSTAQGFSIQFVSDTIGTDTLDYFIITAPAGSGGGYNGAKVAWMGTNCSNNHFATLGTLSGGLSCPDTLEIPNCFCQQMESLADTAYYNYASPGCTGCSVNEFIASVFNDQYGAIWGTDTLTAAHIAHWRSNCSANESSCFQYPLDMDTTGCTEALSQTYDFPDELRCWEEDDCESTLWEEYEWWGDELERQAILERRDEFLNQYLASCMNGAYENEDLTMHFQDREYQWTLYYYDVAGNLVRTVPPAGVQPLTGADIGLVDKHRHAPGDFAAKYPLHSPSHSSPQDELVTYYEYNTFGEVQKQETPDGGETEFWYDVLGRVCYSQNDKQENYTDPTYSTTVYDELGRVTDVYEVTLSASLNNVYTDNNTYDFVNKVGTGGYQAETISDWTSTTYDEPSSEYVDLFGTTEGHNLRNRVSKVTRYMGKVTDINTATLYENLLLSQVTYYSYDPHGNVQELVQEYREGDRLNPSFKMDKHMSYSYDLISGNVNEMRYQDGEADMWVHQYHYDADNRLTNVYTTRDGVIWDHDAHYEYYKHGPLARMEIGDHQLQGIDYAYTIHGWLKGVNSNMLEPQYDMGKDGLESNTYLGSGTEGLHHNFGNDVFGFSLGYYHNTGDDYYDYKMIGGGASFEASLSSGGTLSNLRSGTHNLYNGNIGHMVTNIPDPSDLDDFVPIGYTYRYDQLNRIKGMTAYTGLSGNTWNGTGSSTTAWNTTYSYDPNGNILSLTRNDASGTLLDNLSYTYNTSSGRLLNNQLVSADDPVDGGMGDIYDQHDYTYDEIGNLLSDPMEEIEEIVWDPYGKIWQIERVDTSSLPDLEFRYDGMGQRVMKIVKPHNTKQEDWTYNIYARDASGNIIAVYTREWEKPGFTHSFTGGALTVTMGPELTPNRSVIGLTVDDTYITDGPILARSSSTETATALANAINAYDDDFTAEVDGDVVYIQYSGGYEEPFKIEFLQDDPEFKYNDVFGFVQMRLLGRSLSSTVPLATQLNETVTLEELHLYGSSRLGLKIANTVTAKSWLNTEYSGSYGNGLYLSLLDSRDSIVANPTDSTYFNMLRGGKQYELSNHLGNVLVVIDDKKIAHEGATGEVGHYTASILNVSDYYPFGWTLPGRLYSSGGYRFGFNGMEKDDEIKSSGNSLDFGARLYDSRLGKWWSVDPLAHVYKSSSPYVYTANNPIVFIDPDGEKVVWSNNFSFKNKRLLKTALRQLRKDEVFRLFWKQIKKSTATYTIDNNTLPTEAGAFEGNYKHIITMPNVVYDDEGNESIDGEIVEDDPNTADLTKGGFLHMNMDIFSGLNAITKSEKIDFYKSVIVEEVIHNAQYDLYVDLYGMYKDQHPGSGSIEFEAKTISGLIMVRLGDDLHSENSSEYLPELYAQELMWGSSTSGDFNTKAQEWIQRESRNNTPYGNFRVKNSDKPLQLERALSRVK